MTETKTMQAENERQTSAVDGTLYEVVPHYVGDVAFIELLKRMLKRDLELKMEDE
jgi:hypothetical protein